MQEILAKQFYGNTVGAYIWFAVSLALSVILVWGCKKFILRVCENWSKKHAAFLQDLLFENIEKNLLVPAYFLAFWLNVQRLLVSETALKFLNVAAKILFAYYGIHFLTNFVTPLVEHCLGKKNTFNHKQTATVIKILLQILIWALTLTLLLDNLGIRVSALVTGFGIGGVAIALASQSILGDLFSYFIIFFDRPFELGDYIVVGEFRGTVENIGIKTTRLRSLDGEELVFSNTDLTGSRVRNYKRMNLRRVIFRLNLPHQTPLDKLQEIPRLLETIIREQQQASFDRAHLAELGASTLIFEVVYYVLSNDYNRYMDIQQAINFRIKAEFAQRNIELAYPAQTIFLQKENAHGC
ncbi:MAG: mechanosensitive ion channel family protein [Candidatus Margulisbacteria bacterium]|jgi:small-conductance mechanosensitive channel|nr:mechanosensitive ion channel family protein [Candidatus Margulisiibacteriota bacterium]